jgi:Ala-tRNA(Pro) deacylase
METKVSSELSLLKALDDAGITWKIYEHEAVFTVEQSAGLHDEIPGMHSKNLFLKDASGEFWVVSAPHDASVDLKALAAAIGAKKVSFGKPEDMTSLLGIAPGSVTPLAAINDAAGAVKFVIDDRLAAAECVNFHPLRNTATLGLSGSGLISYLTSTGHSPVIVAVPARL